MSVSRFIAVLLARWKLGLLVWISVVALVMGALLLTKPLYTASASVLVDGKQFDPVAGAVLQAGGLTPGFIGTQVDVAKSETVVLRAIRALKLDEQATLRQQWQASTEGRGSYDAWLAELLVRSYDVRPSRDSNALTLSYTSPDPEFAAFMSNALMDAYIDATLDLRTDPAKKYNTFFDQRAKQLRDNLEKSQTKLSAYLRANGLLATDDRFDVENAKLAELSSQVISLQSAAGQAIGRQDQASLTPDRMQEVLSNPVVATLTTDVSRLQAKLQELSANLGDQHPQVIETKTSLAELRKRLNEATQRASGSVIISGTVARSQLAQAQAALDKQRTRVLQLKEQRDEAAVLQRDVEAAQRSYELVLARVSQTEMESQNRETNVSVLKRASPPAFPSSPKVFLNTAVGLLLGFLLAIGAVLLREAADRRVRVEDDIFETLNLPILAVVPLTLGDSDRRTATRLTALKTRVLSGVTARAT